MLERLGCALHAALQFVNVELARGHHALPFSLQTSRRATKLRSAGNDGPATSAAQDRADRTRFGDREYDDRQRRLAGKRECGRVHDLVAALQRLRVGQTVKALGSSVLLGIGAVDPIDIGSL